MIMKVSSVVFAALVALCVLGFVGCDRNPFGSKLTLANYNKITTGMSKSQVEEILGKPTRVETKDMVIFKKTTYRYEDGKNFAMITFKNDEVDGKDTNLSPNS
jgi:outer membrane protein assembly factor BamE (lipoprotein component of BamABCDE complex)